MFELQFFGKALLYGAALAFSYEGLKVFRRLISHGTVWMALEDLAYWLTCGFLIFRMLYRRTVEPSGASPLRPWCWACFFTSGLRKYAEIYAEISEKNCINK